MTLPPRGSNSIAFAMRIEILSSAKVWSSGLTAWISHEAPNRSGGSAVSMFARRK